MQMFFGGLQLEYLIIIFVIFSIVSSISKKRAEERKRQEKQAQTRLQNAYPPEPGPRREPAKVPYTPPRQVNDESQYAPPTLNIPQRPQYAPPPEPFEPQTAQHEPPLEAAPPQTLFDQFFGFVEAAMPKSKEPAQAQPAQGEGFGSVPMHPAMTPMQRREAAPTVAEKLAAQKTAPSESALPVARRAEGFAQSASRRDIINGIIWSEILTRPSERTRRRAF